MNAQLEDLRKAIDGCTQCELHKNRNHIVFGEGYEEARIMLIGEGPGFEEDKTGRPFVGRSGQLLDKILAVCNFSREKYVFIGNIVKCRPPENRAPFPEERQTCLPYLLKQIEIIDPPILILLGATAIQGLLDPKAKISKERGHWQRWNNRWVMPTYHPSALLRNPNLKKDSWEDFKEVIKKYRELVDPTHYCEHF